MKAMKMFGFVLFLSFIPFIAIAQEAKGSLEIIPYTQIDKYPEFLYKTNRDNPNTFYTSIMGASFGININYKWYLRNAFDVKMGIGYYRYSFNKIKGHSPLFGPNHARIIWYPSPIYILFATDKYWYHTIGLNTGVGKLLNINKNLELTGAVNVTNYITYRQHYRITNNYPTGPPDHKFITNDIRYFGFSVNTQAALLYRLGKMSLGPSIILPVFDLWEKDDVFPQEKDGDYRKKWFRGVAVGLSFNLFIN